MGGDVLEGYVGIFDMDAEYRSCLMRGLTGCAQLKMPLVEFTRLDSILTFAKAKPLKLLLLPDLALTEELFGAGIGGIVLLTEEPVKGTNQTGDTRIFGWLFKYQPVTKLAGEIQVQYQLLSTASAALRLDPLMEPGVIYGVYSPVKRCLKSSFAIALAQLLGERQSTLLLSFEAHSPLLAMLDMGRGPGGGNLSDALYYHLQGSLQKHRSELVKSCHSFDVLAPVDNPRDLENLTAQEVREFIRDVAGEYGYGCVVVDFGDVLTGMNQILECCERIFMPVKADWISQEKKERYKAYVEQTQPELSGRLQEVQPPYHHVETGSKKENVSNFSRLTSGAFYDYVRGCL
jgi:hypothetical protein